MLPLFVIFYLYLNFLLYTNYFVEAYNFIPPKTSSSIIFNRKLCILNASTKIADKTRIRLLTDIKDFGKKGEIIMVSKSMWTNVLQPKKSAEQISDIELARIENEIKDANLKAIEDAKDVSNQIASIKKVSLKRKIGKNNKLFGTVTLKNIIDELKLHITNNKAEVLTRKYVNWIKLNDAVTDNNIDYIKLGEIRLAGEFQAVLQLHPNVENISFLIEIIEEN